jgi:hypothetical protein
MPPPQDDDLPADLRAAFAVLSAYANRRGYSYTGIIKAFRAFHFQLTPHPGGRPMIDDTARLERMVQHLERDTDLVARLAAGGKTAQVHSEAARRTLCELPRPGDLTKDGAPERTAITRLVDHFMRECGFALSDREGDQFAGRGFDAGYWTNRAERPPKPRRRRQR